MAAWASNILVCWERRITRDSLQTQAGTAAQSCSSFESCYCLNLGNFKQVKLIFRMKRLSCRPVRFFRLEDLSAAALQGTCWEVQVKKDGPCSHLSVGSYTQQAATGVTHQQCCWQTNICVGRHTHTINTTHNKHVYAGVMSDFCSACP